MPLGRLHALAAAQGRVGSVIEVRALQAVALQAASVPAVVSAAAHQRPLRRRPGADVRGGRLLATWTALYYVFERRLLPVMAARRVLNAGTALTLALHLTT